MRNLKYLLILVIHSAICQPTVSPTPQQAGTVRGENVLDYNITNSFETGYRFNTVDGNSGMYRSSVNFRNGIRLLTGSFGANSKDGRGL